MTLDVFSLSGRVALVTGAGSPDGIGFATARILGGLGARVAVAATSERARARAEELRLLGIEAYAAARPNGIGRLPVERVVDLQRAYEKLKDERRQLDFEDVLLACAGMLEAEPHVARAVHEQYRHFTVDEFQDVSPLQHRLLELWLGDRRDLCVVGDASQTIYSFAGADARYLLEFASRHDEA